MKKSTTTMRNSHKHPTMGRLFCLLQLLTIGIIFMPFYSCSDDHDNENKNQSIKGDVKKLIVGEWKLAFGNVYNNKNEFLYSYNSNTDDNVVFSEDGYYITDQQKYSISGSTLSFIPESGIKYNITKLDNDSLVLKRTINYDGIGYETIHFKRISFDGSDNKIIKIQYENNEFFIGEWIIEKEEYYRGNKVNMTYTSNTRWLLDANGNYYQIENIDGGGLNESGGWSPHYNNLLIGTIEDISTYDVISADNGSLILKDDAFSPYSYRNTYLTQLSTAEDLLNSSKKFIGIWCLNDGNSDISYWNFSTDGQLYIGKEADVDSNNCISKQSWAYAPVSEVIVTTTMQDDIPFLPPTYNDPNSYMWRVTSYKNDKWIGKALYRTDKDYEKEVTFTKVK